MAAKRVKFVKGRAALACGWPTRRRDFRLPVIRSGLLNSAGTQDLVVHILARSRYEAANFPNVTIPTNLAGAGVRSRFGEVRPAPRRPHRSPVPPGAVVTEYAWQPTSCDPCPGPVLSPEDLATLGGDVLVPQARAVASSAGVRVQIGRPNVVGSLDAQIVRRVIHRHAAELRYCAERAAQRGAGNQGRLDVRLLIDGVGKVPAAKAESPALAEASACITQRMKRWAFPAPKDGVVQVSVPLMFLPDGRRSGFGGRQPASPFTAFVLTRLHYRYTPGDLGEDLVFAPAEGIIGGRETYGAANSFGAAPASASTFQGRYIIRHPWEGKIACKDPVRGIWGGPPGGGSPRASAGRDLALAKRGALKLEDVVKSGLPTAGTP
ncbi:MAG: AgmX/PglI C-terminal domain-containing protein [bacterium]